MATPNIITADTVVRVQKFRQVVTKGQFGSSWRNEPDGWITATIRLSFDVDDLARDIGAKAIRNKKHCSKLRAGSIVAKAFNIIHEPQV